MEIYSDLKVCDYDHPGHPDTPSRIMNSYRHLKTSGFHLVNPWVFAEERDVLTVHTRAHWTSLKKGRYFDPDTPVFEGIDAIALIGLSGALSAMEFSLDTKKPSFSLMRPPGHHAGPERVAGFCLINNMAVACVRALSKGQRIAVLDFDSHHGNGTEEIALGNRDWMVVSLHQSPLFPGTGLKSMGNCLNYPLEPYTKEKDYLPVLEQALLEITDFKPDLLGVSAGFDGYKEETLSRMKLEKKTFKKIGRLLAQTGLPRFAVLEGGYSDDLPLLIENFLNGFAG